MEWDEDVLLENTLAVAEADGYAAAYEYLSAHRAALGAGAFPQVEYFLVCLSAGARMRERAISHMEEAILTRGYWYRPEIFDDDDLASIQQDARFRRCRALSDERYAEAKRAGKPVCTFRKKTAEKLLLCLHGNGQNASSALTNWGALASPALQVEALQSGTVDCFSRFRWNDDDENAAELISAVERLPWDAYTVRALAGFSAGCNAILRAITASALAPDALLLQSPFVPFFSDEPERVADAIAKKRIRVHIFCGENDADCIGMAEALFERLGPCGAVFTRQKALRHQFPEKLGAEYRVL